MGSENINILGEVEKKHPYLDESKIPITKNHSGISGNEVSNPVAGS